jgi:predicted Zn-dependent peptidase
MESSAHMADYLLDGELNYHNPSEYSNILSIMESISADDIMDVAEKVLRDPILYCLTPKKSFIIK